jgi:KUP system potassium uptake protein
MDLGFLAGNLGKVTSGGWVPLAVAVAILTLMTTWARGRREVAHALERKARSLAALQSEVRGKQIERVPGTAVYWTVHADEAPALLEQNLSAHHVLHERIVLVTLLGSDEPRVAASERATVSDLGDGFHRVTVRTGFVERTTLPLVLESLREQGLHVDPEDTLFFLGRYAPVASGDGSMAHWRKRLFGLLCRNGPDVALALEIPPERAMEVAVPVVI